MARFFLSRTSLHPIFIAFCIYILFLLSLSKNRFNPAERSATLTKTSVFHQSGQNLTPYQLFRGNEASLSNCPWPIEPLENVVDDVEQLRNSGEKYIFSDLAYSHGLGNLMFQVAGLLSVAAGSNAVLLIPSSTPLRRAFNFQKEFGHKIKFVDEKLKKTLAAEMNQSRLSLSGCCSFRDFNGLLFKDRNIEKVDGYFQNFRYFHPESEKNVKKLFTFVDPVRKLVDEFLETVSISLTVRSAKLVETNVANDDQAFQVPEQDAFADTMIVGVHIRHGMDITMNSRNRKHGHVDAPIEYYRRAIEQISKVYEKVAFIICSDDIMWARWNLKLTKETVHFFCPGPREVDMAILASCDSLIMSTGTFGWWSAYLNVNTSPDIYYYKHWPAAGSVMEKMTNKTEYFPKKWVALE